MPYVPIDCSYYDVLESLAVRRRLVQIVFEDAGGLQYEVESRIVDVFTRGEEEFVRLENGLDVRLDRLQSVDGLPRPGSAACTAPGHPTTTG